MTAQVSAPEGLWSRVKTPPDVRRCSYQYKVAPRERLLLEESDRLAVPGATAKSLNPPRPQREKKTLGSCQLPVFGKKAGIFFGPGLLNYSRFQIGVRKLHLATSSKEFKAVIGSFLSLTEQLELKIVSLCYVLYVPKLSSFIPATVFQLLILLRDSRL